MIKFCCLLSHDFCLQDERRSRIARLTAAKGRWEAMIRTAVGMAKAMKIQYLVPPMLLLPSMFKKLAIGVMGAKRSATMLIY
jgi:hypothetical protein